MIAYVHCCNQAQRDGLVAMLQSLGFKAYAKEFLPPAFVSGQVLAIYAEPSPGVYNFFGPGSFAGPSFEDFVKSAVFLGLFNPPVVEIRLNSEYTAVVDHVKMVVVVGCQSFTFAAIKELNEQLDSSN